VIGAPGKKKVAIKSEKKTRGEGKNRGALLEGENRPLHLDSKKGMQKEKTELATRTKEVQQAVAGDAHGERKTTPHHKKNTPLKQNQQTAHGHHVPPVSIKNQRKKTQKTATNKKKKKLPN